MLSAEYVIPQNIPDILMVQDKDLLTKQLFELINTLITKITEIINNEH